MIRRPGSVGFALALALALPAGARGQTSAVGTPPVSSPLRAADGAGLARYRLPLDALIERTLGNTSRAVRFDWRSKAIGVGAFGSQVLELNNFGSARFGLLARRPWGSLMTELSLARVETWGSTSATRLSLTPYRQAGRPSRFELGLNVGYPLAEGVATARPGFFPATELVFSVNAELRYLYYPGALSGATFGQVARAALSPRLSAREMRNLEDDRLPAMDVDRGRYGLLVGFTFDIYFAKGGFVSPRVMMAPFGSAALGWWWDLAFAAGWMF